ncbi:MAG TPA: hypothetical protein VKB18_08130 [Gemmatimonadota bacterium]|nr:hypothetical protein [Gemmatimonadota bacterium]
MARTAWTAMCVVGLAAAVGACGGGSTGPAQGSLSAAEARDLAATMDGSGNQVIGDQTGRLDVAARTGALADVGGGTSGAGAAAPSPDVLSSSTSFHTERDCRLGGTLTVDGRVDHTYDTSTRTLTADFRATVTHDACVLTVRGHDITVTGNPNLTLEAHRMRVDGLPSGVQTLSLKGGFTWVKADGTSGSCQVDLTSQLDPDARTRTIDGTFCGHDIHESLSWDTTGG